MGIKNSLEKLYSPIGEIDIIYLLISRESTVRWLTIEIF